MASNDLGYLGQESDEGQAYTTAVNRLRTRLAYSFFLLLSLFLSKVIDIVIIFKQDFVLQWVGERIGKVN